MGKSCGRNALAYMTAHANKMTKRASTVEQPTIPAHTIRVFVDALERLGYDTDSVLAQAGVSRSILAEPDNRISCTVFSGILGAAIEQRPLKNLAAQLAAATPIGAFPLVDYLAITSETVGAALTQLARYLRLNEAPYSLDPRAQDDPIRVVFDRPLSAFAVEFGVTLTALHLREEAEPGLQLSSIHFSHTPDDPAQIEQLLSSAIVTNSSWSGFVLSREAWDTTMRRRDPALRSLLEQHAAAAAARVPDTDSFARDVRRVLLLRMTGGDTRIQGVARALATSTRSLQRRLAGAGLSYQQLLDRTRRDAAAEYLSDPALSVGEVGYLLGYSEVSAFHRAFRRWNGVTPQAFRKRRMQHAVS